MKVNNMKTITFALLMTIILISLPGVAYAEEDNNLETETNVNQDNLTNGEQEVVTKNNQQIESTIVEGESTIIEEEKTSESEKIDVKYSKEGDRIRIEFTLAQEINITQIYFYFNTPSNGSDIIAITKTINEIEHVSNNTYSTTIDIGSNFIMGDYILKEIRIQDNEGNENNYNVSTSEINILNNDITTDDIHEDSVGTISIDKSELNIKTDETTTLKLTKTYEGQTGYIIENSADSIVLCEIEDSSTNITNVIIDGKKEGKTNIKFYSIDNPDINATVKIEVSKQKDGWIIENGNWHFYNQGIKLTNSWKSDSKGWCYLDSDGNISKGIMRSDSKGLCYIGNDGYWQRTAGWINDKTTQKWAYIGSNGYALKNTMTKDSTGLCYIGNDGYWQVKSGWVNDKATQKWAYIGSNGYALKNTMMKDSKGLCYIGNDGYWQRTAGWVNDKAMQKWTYIGSNGYALKNTTVKDSAGLCYIGNDGYWLKSIGWRLDNATNKWVYIGSNGYAVKNEWIVDSKGWCYLNNEGYWRDNTYLTIMLDPGHGGFDPGATSGSIKEVNLNNNLVTTLANKLKAKGINVIYTRNPSSNTYLSLEDRATLANNANPDLLISIHHDAPNVKGYSLHYSSYRPNIEYSGAYFIKNGKKHYVIREDGKKEYYIENGIEKYIDIGRDNYTVYDATPSEAANNSKNIAYEIYNQMQGLNFISPRGNPVQDHNLAITRWTTMPSVLVEAGPTNSFMNDSIKQNTIADKIVKAVGTYFKINSI